MVLAMEGKMEADQEEHELEVGAPVGGGLPYVPLLRRPKEASIEMRLQRRAEILSLAAAELEEAAV